MITFVRSHAVICIVLLLVAASFAVFGQTLGHDFVKYDDPDYVTSNQHVQAGLTQSSVVWAFTSTEEANWHPLTWLSHMMDVQMYGRKPWGHHLTNVLLHILSTLLLFLVLRRMTGFVWRSAFVAAIFAVHPLHVESVAWIAERKDVLSAAFWMLTLLAYVRYVESPGRKRYITVVFLYGLGLMAKPMLVSLPLLLLLLDYWPLRRTRTASSERKQQRTPCALFVEKLPLIAMAGASCAVTWIAQDTGAMVSTDHVTLGIRLPNAFVSYVEYIIKAVWPARLSMHYQHPENTLPGWQVYGAAILLVCACALAIRYRRQAPYFFVGWFWYVITLVPVIGLVQVGGQAMADRYMYIPLIGLSLGVTWAAASVAAPRSDPNKVSRTAQNVLAIVALATLVALTMAAHAQASYWKDSVTLFSHAVRATPGNARAEALLASALKDRGDLKGALQHYSKSIHIRPNIASRQSEMGLLLVRLGRADEGIVHCRAAVRLAPRHAGFRNNLGVAFLGVGRPRQALKQFREALQLEPTSGEAHGNIAIQLFYAGRYKEAWQEALLSRKYGVEPHPGFIAALTQHMQKPR